MSSQAHADPGKSSSADVPARAEWSSRRTDSLARAEPTSIDLLQRAADEGAGALDAALCAPLAAQVGHDFSHVRVHGGPESSAAAERLGARAYTLGRDIHLGAEAVSLVGGERTPLLAHEAVQGLIDTPRASRSLALCDRLRPAVAPPLGIARQVTPQVQRDLTGKYPVREGEFNLSFATASIAGNVSGLRGTIKFKANDKAPDSKKIRLLQVARDQDLSTGRDYSWSGNEENRNKVMTTEDKSRGVEGGFMVDHVPADAKERTKKGDPEVSPYYRTYWPNEKLSHDGSKDGKIISEASLWDFPRSTVMWGFEITDPANEKIGNERAVGRNVTLLTTDKAIEEFNEFYRNSGASTEPK